MLLPYKSHKLKSVLSIGQVIESASCQFLWVGNICDPGLNLPTKSIASKLCLPLSNNLQPLKELVDSLKTVLGNNFMPVMGVFGGLLLGISYQTIIRKFGYCPIVLAQLW